MLRHTGLPHGHVAGEKRLDPSFQPILAHAEEVWDVMSHGVHSVMRLVAVKGPVAGVVGNELDVARGAHRDEHGGFGPTGRFGYPAAIGGCDPEPVAVDMDRVLVNAQVAEPDANPVAGFDDQGGGAWKHPAVEGKRG